MPLIKINAPNWDKFNPRSDRANFTWFRLQNDFLHDQVVFSLTDAQRVLYLFCLCELSKKNSNSVELLTDYIASVLRKKEKEIISGLNVLNERKLIAVIKPAESRHEAAKEPPSLPATIRNETNETNETPKPQAINVDEVTQAIEEWGITLKHFNNLRDPKFDAKIILDLVKTKGLPRTLNAIRGFRAESKSASYEPAKYVNSVRLSEKFVKLESLGEFLASQEASKPRKNRAKPDCEQCRGVGMYLPPLDEDSDSSTNVMKSCECAEEQTA